MKQALLSKDKKQAATQKRNKARARCRSRAGITRRRSPPASSPAAARTIRSTASCKASQANCSGVHGAPLQPSAHEAGVRKRGPRQHRPARPRRRSSRRICSPCSDWRHTREAARPVARRKVSVGREPRGLFPRKRPPDTAPGTRVRDRRQRCGRGVVPSSSGGGHLLPRHTRRAELPKGM
jgi:hypothetical protein